MAEMSLASWDTNRMSVTGLSLREGKQAFLSPCWAQSSGSSPRSRLKKTHTAEYIVLLSQYELLFRKLTKYILQYLRVIQSIK
jgi:hypothetical protein